MAIAFPTIDPVIVTIYGPFAIRWYSLAYIAGILLGWWHLLWHNKSQHIVMNDEAKDNIIVWIIVSIVIGGRLGYVLFYQLAHYLSNLKEIFYLWSGGMSFHGGMAGFAIGLYLFARKYNIPPLKFGDLLAASAPIGLFFGRIANFINGELYGRITSSPLGVIFPSGGPLPRHASQIYEAILEGLVLFIILNIAAIKGNSLKKPGFITGLFLILYSIFRIIVENFREPDIHLGYILPNVTMGQILSLPMLFIGIFLLCTSIKSSQA